MNWIGKGSGERTEHVRAEKVKTGKRTARQGAPKKTPPKRHLYGWSPDTIPAGSPEEARHIEALVDKINDYQYDFMSYEDDMQDWKEPTKMQTKIDRANTEYCRHMLDICLNPLTHGVNGQSVLSAVGLYTGMALLSPEFRKTVKKDVSNVLLPVVEKQLMAKAEREDAWRERQAKKIMAKEEKTGEAMTGRKVDRVFSDMSAREEAAARIERMRAESGAYANNGRIPLTPESAATLYLNFSAQYYNAVRDTLGDPVATDELQKQYKGAIEKLYEMAEMDGISESRLNQNIMAVYGKVSSKYPDMARYFTDTAYDEIMKDVGETVTLEDGREANVWRGEYIYAASGENYKGPLMPRMPMTATGHLHAMTSFFDDLYGSCSTVEECSMLWEQPHLRDVVDYFHTMIKDDMMFSDESGMTGDLDDYATYEGQPPEEIIDVLIMRAHENAGRKWAKEHPEAQASKQRDASGIQLPDQYSDGYEFE